MTRDDLTRLNGLYVRYLRLIGKSSYKPTAADRSMAYVIRLELEELGLDLQAPQEKDPA